MEDTSCVQTYCRDCGLLVTGCTCSLVPNPQRNVTHNLPHVDIKNHISELEVYLDNINTLRDKHQFGETKSAFNAVCNKTQDLIATMKKEVNL